MHPRLQANVLRPAASPPPSGGPPKSNFRVYLAYMLELDEQRKKKHAPRAN